MFRPGVRELVALFPTCHCLAAEVVDGGSLWDYGYHTIFITLPWVARHTSSLAKRDVLSSLGSFLIGMFKPSRITCAILQKVAERRQ
jgi:hypothetical protein